MKNIVIYLSLFIFSLSRLCCQNNNLELKFDESGKFKIVQFTDLHVKLNDNRSDAAFECMHNVITGENPDLIVITGDIIYSSPADETFLSVMEFVSKYNIPFTFVFGNHDRQQGMSNLDLYKIAKGIDNCIVNTTDGITGVVNHVLEIKDRSGMTDYVLYLFDSNEDSRIKENGIGGYDHIHRDQIEWYVKTSKSYAMKNNGPVKSLAFFHIPIPEFHEAASNEDISLYGIRRERVCSPLLNSGLFCAMKEQGDIIGIFVGHDHDNDYAVNWYSTLLAYGRFSGGPTEYIHIPNGARVIELVEGKRIINTYIRLSSGNIEQYTTFPKDYVK